MLANVASLGTLTLNAVSRFWLQLMMVAGCWCWLKRETRGQTDNLCYPENGQAIKMVWGADCSENRRYGKKEVIIVFNMYFSVKTAVKCWKYRTTTVKPSNLIICLCLYYHATVVSLYNKFLALQHLSKRTKCCCKLVISTGLACNCGWWCLVWTGCCSRCLIMHLSTVETQQTHDYTSYTSVYFMVI